MNYFDDKIRCEICHKKFKLNKQDVYQVQEPCGALAALTGPTRRYDAVDCPHCGCQKILIERYDRIGAENSIESKEEKDIE